MIAAVRSDGRRKFSSRYLESLWLGLRCPSHTFGRATKQCSMPIPHMFDASLQLAAISTQDFAEDPSQASRSKKARSGSDATFTRSVEIEANLTVGTAPRGADACGVFCREPALENRWRPLCASASGRSPRRLARPSTYRGAIYHPYPSNASQQVLSRSSQRSPGTGMTICSI